MLRIMAIGEAVKSAICGYLGYLSGDWVWWYLSAMCGLISIGVVFAWLEVQDAKKIEAVE